jgi:tRNA (cmo5U34)-methyltransferase
MSQAPFTGLLAASGFSHFSTIRRELSTAFRGHYQAVNEHPPTMPRPLHEKSTVGQIRARFDADVERFSVLETGQQAAMDAPIILDLVARSAAGIIQPHGALFDVGCGAGNFTLRVLNLVSPLDCTLVDLSQPMLDRARQRVSAAASGKVQTIQSDMRMLDFAPASFDIILAGQTLHHLREDAQWEAMFANLYRWLRPGGALFVADMIAYDDPTIQSLMLARYGEYLESLGGPEYRDKVFAYVDEEDSPRSVKYQFDCLAKAGFTEYDVLHKNALFVAYYAKKSR